MAFRNSSRTGPVTSLIVVLVIGLLAVLAPSAGGAQQGGGFNPVEAPVVDQQLEVHVAPFVVLPNRDNGEETRVIAITSFGDRVFAVTDFEGRIFEITGGTAALWFDVSAALFAATGRRIDEDPGGQDGLRSLAFHPDFATNGKIYTTQMEERTGDTSGFHYLSDVPNPTTADGVLTEWTVGADDRVSPNSHREVFRVGMEYYNHPIKQLAFDPSQRPGDPDYGLLYIAHGDGDTYAITDGAGQANNALGKVLRIDPLQRGAAPYTIPASNPFIADPNMLSEVFSLGHRNPHHLAFAQDGTLLAADTGHDNVDEINRITSGGNYGWPMREGTFVHLAEGGLGAGIAPLPANDADFGFEYPAAQVGHNGTLGAGPTGHALAGGRVIENGSPLSGLYLYGQFVYYSDLYYSTLNELQVAVTSGSPAALTQAPTGRARIFFDHDANAATPAQPKADLLDVFDDSPLYVGFGRSDLRFGQGPAGEVYISSKRNNSIYVITSSLPGGPGGFAVTCNGRTATHIGTEGDDVIAGTEGDDVIATLGGNDLIAAGGGNDVVCAGAGDDRVWGQGGDDLLGGGDGDDILRGGDGADVVDGGPGVDDLNGGRGDDHVRGGPGNDSKVRGGTGDDYVAGDEGDDALIAGNGGSDYVVGGAGNDSLVTGGPRPDLLRGGSGNDILRGHKGADQIFGDGGNDQLFGGEQSDELDGGTGNDICNGGAGTESAVLIVDCAQLINVP